MTKSYGKNGFKNAGFTLVELLVVISIIGILVGMLIPAIGAVNRRAAEHAIQTDVNNLEMALEAFKTKHGFFPPDMTEINSAAEFLPYLSRISRNHAEGNGAAGTGLQIWWDEVGQHLNPETALAFWLTGLADNAQFPLTFDDPDNPGTRVPLPAYNVGVVGSGGTPVDIARLSLIDMKPGQVAQLPGDTLPNLRAAFVQGSGTSRVPILYFSASSYDVFLAQATADQGFHVANVDMTTVPDTMHAAPVSPFSGPNVRIPVAPYSDAGIMPEVSQDSFQLVTAGVDKQYGATGDISNVGKFDRDNVCSFAEGRLERVFLSN